MTHLKDPNINEHNKIHKNKKKKTVCPLNWTKFLDKPLISAAADQASTGCTMTIIYITVKINTNLDLGFVLGKACEQCTTMDTG